MIIVGAATSRNREAIDTCWELRGKLGGVLAGFTQVNIGRLFVALAGILHMEG
jgi:hypothetical protein